MAVSGSGYWAEGLNPHVGLGGFRRVWGLCILGSGLSLVGRLGRVSWSDDVLGQPLLPLLGVPTLLRIICSNVSGVATIEGI